MADKAVPPKGARLLPIGGKDDEFILWNYLVKQPIDSGWHNYRDFDKVLSTGNLVTASDGKKWLVAEGYTGETKSFTGNLLYEDRDKIWYDLPTAVVPAPRAPTGLTAQAVSWSSITITFSSPDGAPLEIERTDDISKAFAKMATVPGNETSFTDKNLPGSTPYYYRARCVSDGGASEYAGPVTATTSVKPADPSPTPSPAPSPAPSTPTPTSTTTSITNAANSQKTDWLSANLSLVLIGAGALLAVVIVVLANRD